MDIRTLTEAWSKELATYPHWYVPPYEVCEELASKTSEVGLLQCHAEVDSDMMFDFCYELVWRYEKSMNDYSDYEVRNIRQIWENYAQNFKNPGKEELAVARQEQVEKWFDVGMALLREYRECSMDAEWDAVYKALKPYAKYRWHGEQILQVEKAKQAFFQMDIPAMRRCLDRCDLDKTDYELRLQMLGIRVELDEAEAVVEELQRLNQEIRQASVEQPENYLYYTSLHACALQLYGLCVQGVWDHWGMRHIRRLSIVLKMKSSVMKKCLIGEVGEIGL